MGLLTPLYLAGLAALSLPVLLHLIRRTPRGRQAFSSLMFLSPSPPRLTRRSRLDHLLLLLLRLTALALLAFAFARPFLRESAMLPLDDLPGRRVAILLDTSASMRRGDLWQRAVKKAADILDDLGPADDVSLLTFDDRRQTIVDFADETDGLRIGKADMVKGRLSTLGPSWRATDLGAALVAVAAELDTASDVQGAVSEPLLVVVSDFARGSKTDALQAYRWPAKVPVVAHALSPERTTNAAVQFLLDEEGPLAAEPRVRVANAGNSTADQFQVSWSSPGKGQPPENPLSVYVPAGQTRVLRLPRPEGAGDRIVLDGDDADFDNTYYVVPPRPGEVRVAWLGADMPDDAESPRYFFELAVGDDPLRKVAVQSGKTLDDLQLAGAEHPAMLMATSAIPAEGSEPLKSFVSGGGTLLVLATDQATAESVVRLLDDVEWEGRGGENGARQAEKPDLREREYSMLGEIDFAHPLFAAFGSPRYSDFTKIHFWRHQTFALKQPATTRVVARFDNGEPAILERAIGGGRIFVFASGWQPEQSQLALSSKFVPLMQALIDLTAGGPEQATSLTVGQNVPLTAITSSAVVERPDGTRVKLAENSTAFSDADQPGVYRLHVDGEDRPFAVNLAAAESNTAPIDLESLEQLGVRFSSKLSRVERAEQVRQQRDTELESRQHLWRWLIIAALALLILETFLAGRAARKLRADLSTTSSGANNT
ncbi:MAG TPA: BatA domain-containing protein [Pirellulales bacterium]|nr:BatA domain-containing protein [Pirellulales bacterium]